MVHFTIAFGTYILKNTRCLNVDLNFKKLTKCFYPNDLLHFPRYLTIPLRQPTWMMFPVDTGVVVL